MHVRRICASSLGLEGERTYDLWGDVPPAPRIAVVGSRAAHRQLVDLVEVIAQEAKNHGHTLVSGGALGIDAAAHRHFGTHAVAQMAVLPCGSDRIYPEVHRQLFMQIVQQRDSGLLFAHAHGTLPARGTFVSRNALIVALASRCVVVQAQCRSGSEVTGREALRRGQPVAAVVGTPGCAALIARGATALPAEDPQSLRAALRNWWVGQGAASPWPSHLHWLKARFAAVRGDRASPGIHVEQLGGADVLQDLCEAEVLGLVASLGSGRWVCL